MSLKQKLIVPTGLFKLQTAEGGECGEVDVPSVLSMEAVKWYIEYINNQGNLPFKVGFRYYKTCGKKDVTREHAADIVYRFHTNNSSDFIVGVIGPELSSESTAASSVFSAQPSLDRFIQISYSSTSTELNNRDDYPNYYRVIPDDDVQIEAMVQLMLKLEWNRVSILFENDAYGRDGADNLEKYALRNNICVPRIDAINIDESRRVDANEVKDILEEIIIQSPHITAVVYIGSKTVANTILRIAEKQNYNDVPIFLLSESIQLQNDVFHAASGTTLKKPRGAMTVSAPMLNTTTTETFWNQMKYTLWDEEALYHAMNDNIFLADIVHAYSGHCITEPYVQCQGLNDIQIEQLVSGRSPYVNYALLAAVTMIETLKETYSTKCQDTVCHNVGQFKNDFKPRYMLDVMAGMTIYLDDIVGTFTTSSPNIQYASMSRLYNVYNYRTNPTDNSMFTFVNVGYLSNDVMLIDKEKIRDYDVDAIETRYPNLRRGTCPRNDRCDECVMEDLKDYYFHVPGDFYIIGIASINNRAIPGPLGCGSVRPRHGYQMFLTMKFALTEFQTRFSYSQYKSWFAGNTIGLIVVNSCNNALEIVRRILHLHSKGLTLSDGTHIDLTDRVLGYIGGQSADVSEPAALQLTKLKFVQISYSATNPLLSNKDTYPYFMRITTPDNVQAKALIAVVKQLKGKYIQVVYSEGAYGEGGRNAVIKEAKANFICIAQDIKVYEGETYYEYYEIMRKKPHAKIVIIFLRSHVVNPFMRDVAASNMETGEFQFLGSEAWGTNSDILQYDVTQGAVVVSVEMDKSRDLEEYLQGQIPSFHEPNPWLNEYIQTRQDCYFEWSFDKSFTRQCTADILPSSELNFESDSWCSSTFFKDRCGSNVKSKLCKDYVNYPSDLVEVMRKVKMNIYGDGDILIYDEQSDGLMGYKIYNIQDQPDDISKRIYSQVGSYSLSTGLLLDVQELKYPTLYPIISSCPSTIACKDCQETSDDSTTPQPTVEQSSSVTRLFKLQTAEGGECGEVDVPSVLSMEAVKWYIEYINNQGNLPFKVGFRYYKTCGKKDVTREHAADIVYRFHTNNSSDFIVGVIGPELSSESTAASSVFSAQPSLDRFIQISYSSTSTELNNRDDYPNYYRVIPDDDVQIEKYALRNNICVPRIDAINIDESRRVDANEVKDILEEIIIQSPHITAVVYIGSKTVANTILRIAEKQNYNDVPIFLLSESIQLQNDVFHAASGTTLKKPRGAMTVSAPMLNTTTTETFWNQMKYTLWDEEALYHAMNDNIFLADIVHAYSGHCITEPYVQCQGLNDIQIEQLVSGRSPYVNYALLAAVTMIETLKETYSTKCQDTVCHNVGQFKNDFKPRYMLDVMAGMTIYLDDIVGTFTTSSPNIQYASMSRLYDVYNYRTNPTDNSMFTFVNVGYLSNDVMLIDKEKIRDYDVDAIETRYPNLRRGTCPRNDRCDECVMEDLKDYYFHVPGDFYIIGIASINNRAIPGPLGCGSVRPRHGYQMFLTMKFALTEFQTRFSYSQYKSWFAGNTIGLIVVNSCNNALEIVRRILHLHSKGLTLSDGTHIDLTDRVLGYIGGQSADVSEPAALQLTKLKFVQISYSATNPLLSNKDTYPYFMRITTPDNVQAKALIAVVKQLKGKYIQVVYSEGAYGEGGRNAVIKEAKANFICIAQDIKVYEGETYYEYYEIMRKKPHAKIVIIFLRSHVVNPFMRDVAASNMETGEFQFLGSEAWGTNSDILQYDVTQGAVVVSVEMDKSRDLEEYLQGQIPSFHEPNPWLNEYIQTRQDCYFEWSFDKSFTRQCTADILPSSELNFESDSWCSSTFFKDRCGSNVKSKLCKDYVNYPSDLVEVMRKVKMNIYGDGDILIYDEQSDGLMGYKIYNIQDQPDDISKRIYSQVGSYSLSTGLLLDVQELKYPTFSPIISSCPSTIACKDCQETSDDGTTPQPTVEQSSSVTSIILGVFIGALIVIIVILSFCLFKYWRSSKSPQQLNDGTKKENNGTEEDNYHYLTPVHVDERQAADGRY
ncbi:hypothetical protein ACF0H5_011471 [Mactra antiquata]